MNFFLKDFKKDNLLYNTCNNLSLTVVCETQEEIKASLYNVYISMNLFNSSLDLKNFFKPIIA